MNWGSAGEFFAMGGYAHFVWGSYGATVLAMAVEVVLAVRRHRRAAAAVTELEQGPGA